MNEPGWLKEATNNVEVCLKEGDSNRAMSKLYSMPESMVWMVVANLLFRLIIALTKAKPKEPASEQH